MIYSIKVIKAFTLIELLVVILLISLVSFLGFSKFDFTASSKKQLKIEEIKTYLLENFDFQKSMKFVCLDYEKYPCFIYLDGKLNKNFKNETLFEKQPRVYKYTKELEDYYLEEVKIDNINYKTVFEIEFNKDYKHKDFILDADNKVYVFNSISNIVKTYANTNEIIDQFYENISKVKDAL